MIHHISIPAQNPHLVANRLAEILNGQVITFPPVPKSYMVMTYDDKGTAIEVYPLGTQLTPADGEPHIVQKPIDSSFVPFHAAISVPVEMNIIENIAKQEGWRVQLCDRGFFKVVELWVENWLLLELLTPDLVSDYLKFTQPQTVEKFLATPSHS